jgi:phytoene synthase
LDYNIGYNNYKIVQSKFNKFALNKRINKNRNMNLTPNQYCQQKVANSSTSFYYSFLLLPKEKRQAIFSVYAFCREIDDLVDECDDPQLALHKLNWWRQELRRIYNNQSTHPVGHALLETIKQYNLKKEWFDTIIDGMEQDLSQNRYIDFINLEQYCWRVAGVVGVISAHIFGFKNPKTIEYAKKLGLSLQLINIIRDVGEDSRRGRVYVPINDLQTYNLSVQSISTNEYSDNFRKLMSFQAQRAYDIYQDAINTLPQEDRSNQRAGLIMGAIYKRLLDEIIDADYQVLHQRISLSPATKLWIASKVWFFSHK